VVTVGYGDKRGDEIMVKSMQEIAQAINEATIASSYQVVTFDQTKEASDGEGCVE
jgi:hypothetical protein